MAKKKSRSTVQKFVVVCLVLTVAQIVFLFMKSSEKPPTVREAIDELIAKEVDLNEKEQAQLKVSLAVSDFMAKNQGTPPASLRELTPTYFDVVPTNPETGQEFSYRVADGRYYIGDMPESGTKTVAASSPGGKSSSGAKGEGDISKNEQDALIATLEGPQDFLNVVYNPSGKRDPFLPFNFAPQNADDPNRTELEKYSIGQLRLTAVLEGFDDPTAIVENNAGKGFTVKKGTKIGTNSGEIIEIQSDKLLILETTVDFTGEKTTRTVEMKLDRGTGEKKP